jgi:NH3-dependent NAD+ synthetase
MSQELEFRIRAIDEASEVFESIGTSAEDALNRVSAASDAVAAAEEKATYSARSLVVGLSGVATSAFSLYQGFDRIEKSQYAVERANYLVQASLKAVEDDQRKYNEAVRKYGADS